MRKAKINSLHRKYAPSTIQYGYRLHDDADNVVRIPGDGMVNDKIVPVAAFEQVTPFTEYYPSSRKNIPQMLGGTSDGLCLLARWIASFKLVDGEQKWAQLFVVKS
jgi:hypothetical protein